MSDSPARPRRGSVNFRVRGNFPSDLVSLDFTSQLVSPSSDSNGTLCTERFASGRPFTVQTDERLRM